MIITCPACHTQFRIAPASLGASGRNVRCSSCGERWFVEAFTEAPPPPLALGEADPGAGRVGRGGDGPRGAAGAVARRGAGAAAGGRRHRRAQPDRRPAAGDGAGLPAPGPVARAAARDRVPRPRLRAPHRRGPAGAGGDGRDHQYHRAAARRAADPRGPVSTADRRELDHGLFDPPEPALGPGRCRAVRGRGSTRRRRKPATSRCRSTSSRERGMAPWSRWRWR